MQQAEVRGFFDRIAPGYAERYAPERAFHHYLFSERLREALSGHTLTGKRLLDLGAGTGPLYDALAEAGVAADYYACDLSAAMLAQSNIPEERRATGAWEETAFAEWRFDYVFGLGLTTYLLSEELSALLRRLTQNLNPGGRAVLSFTNRSGLQWKSRQCLLPLARRLQPAGYVLGQSFQTAAYTPAEVEARLPEGLRLREIRWLTPCLPLLSRWAPQIGIPLARRLSNRWLYSDFLVFLQRV